jgi:hypothetical protein
MSLAVPRNIWLAHVMGDPYPPSEMFGIFGKGCVVVVPHMLIPPERDDFGYAGSISRD